MAKITNYYYVLDNTTYWYVDSLVAVERLLHHSKQRGITLTSDDLVNMIKKVERVV